MPEPVASPPVPFDAEAVADQLTRDLVSVATPERAAQEKAYLKSSLEHLGATVPQIRSAVKAVRASHPGLTHDEVVTLVDALWADPVHERRFAAVEVLELYGSRLGPADLAVVERLVRDSQTWALVDGLAASVAGRIVTQAGTEDALVSRTLDRWAVDEDFWLRRSALLSLLPGLRGCEGDFVRFGRYADGMLDEREFFIRKAIGWVLRDTAKRRPDEVRDWLAARVDRLAGLTLREAVKYLSPADRDELLDAYRGRPRSS